MKITAVAGLVLATSLLAPISSYSATTFECQYEKYSRNGEEIKSASDKQTFVIDTETQKAYQLNEFDGGTYEFILVWAQNDKYSLVQVTPIGNVNAVTIDSELNVVLSRNSTNTLNPVVYGTQYYGKCKIKH